MLLEQISINQDHRSHLSTNNIHLCTIIHVDCIKSAVPYSKEWNPITVASFSVTLRIKSKNNAWECSDPIQMYSIHHHTITPANQLLSIHTKNAETLLFNAACIIPNWIHQGGNTLKAMTNAHDYVRGERKKRLRSQKMFSEVLLTIIFITGKDDLGCRWQHLPMFS